MTKVVYEQVLYQVNGGAGKAANSTSYVHVTTDGSFFLYESASYVSPSIYFEVVMKSVTATTNDTYVRIAYGTTTDSLTPISFISGSERISSTTTFARYVSSAITLTDGTMYGWSLRNESAASATAVVNQVKIVIVDDIGTDKPTKISTEYPLSSRTLASSTSTSYVTINSTFLNFDASKYSGNVSYYFEAILHQPSSGNPYMRLYNETDGVEVSGSELTTTSTYCVRLRSSALTLANGKKYVVQVKTNSGTGGTMYGGGAALLIRQTGEINKTEIYTCLVGNPVTSTSVNYATTASASTYYDSTNRWTQSSTITALHYFKMSSSSYTASAAITTFLSTTLLTSSDVTTTSTSIVEVSTPSLSPTSATNYNQNRKSSSISGTTTVYGTILVFKIVWANIKSQSVFIGAD